MLVSENRLFFHEENLLLDAILDFKYTLPLHAQWPLRPQGFQVVTLYMAPSSVPSPYVEK